jgi:hypothetical protein
MTDLQSSIAKGLLAALCSIVAMVAGAASARQEAQSAPTMLPHGSEFSASRLF